MKAVEAHRRELQASIGPEVVIKVSSSDAIRDLIDKGLKWGPRPG